MARRPILIVEDDESIADSLAEILTDEGYPVVVARHGNEALSRLSAGPLPGLILLDLMMPHMDGYELRRCQLADERLAAVPTWVLTAGGTEHVHSLEVEGWLRKPIDLRQLLAIVARYCGEDNHRHMVEFYREPERLVEHVAHFIADGLDAGESAVLVVEPARWQALQPLLAAGGIEVARLRAVGRLVVKDADETLSLFMRDGLPHPVAFLRTVSPVIDSAVAASGTHRVRAFGEMVNLLWHRGQITAALQLEDAWNRIIDTRPLSLYCAYATPTGAHPAAVAARHTHAIAC
jgi:CheY-like chemotaxis protein